MRTAKQLFYKEKFNTTDSRKLWNNINEILNRKSKNESGIAYLLVNGNKIEREIEIAEEMNKYFTNIGIQLAAKVPTVKRTE